MEQGFAQLTIIQCLTPSPAMRNTARARLPTDTSTTLPSRDGHLDELFSADTNLFILNGFVQQAGTGVQGL